MTDAASAARCRRVGAAVLCRVARRHADPDIAPGPGERGDKGVTGTEGEEG